MKKKQEDEPIIEDKAKKVEEPKKEKTVAQAQPKADTKSLKKKKRLEQRKVKK